MRSRHKLALAFKDPLGFYLYAQNRVDPLHVWKRYSNLCVNSGLSSSRFILSFDCDTENDIEVVWDVHARLQDMGITPVYAVPGELLRKGEKVYRKIHETGAEFINHGGREHTYFDTQTKRHASCFFYDQQPLSVVEEDILLGHQALQDVLGITPVGWRTPHFGTFQQPKQLSFLYRTLKNLNYIFSSSICPIMGYKYGPLYKKDGIIEIPVTGIFNKPFDIMDTWAYFASPDKLKKPSDYIRDTQELASFIINYPIMVNIYGDPSHIHKHQQFFQGMQILSAQKNINYNKMINRRD